VRGRVVGPDADPVWFLGTLARLKLTGEDTGGRFALWDGLLPRGAAPQGFPTLALRGLAGVGGSLGEGPAGSARDALLPHVETSGMYAGCVRRLAVG
jgi:hypothetical protein